RAGRHGRVLRDTAAHAWAASFGPPESSPGGRVKEGPGATGAAGSEHGMQWDEPPSRSRPTRVGHAEISSVLERAIKDSVKTMDSKLQELTLEAPARPLRVS